MNFIEKYREQKKDRLDVNSEIMKLAQDEINKVQVELQMLGLTLKNGL